NEVVAASDEGGPAWGGGVRLDRHQPYGPGVRTRGLVPATLPVGDGQNEVGVETVVVGGPDQDGAGLSGRQPRGSHCRAGRRPCGGPRGVSLGGIGGLGGEREGQAEAGRDRDRQARKFVHATETSWWPADLLVPCKLLLRPTGTLTLVRSGHQIWGVRRGVTPKLQREGSQRLWLLSSPTNTRRPIPSDCTNSATRKTCSER